MVIKTKAEELQRLRVLAGYNINELSRRSGIPYSTISCIERKKKNPSPATAKKICDTFGVDFDTLFEIKEGE